MNRAESYVEKIFTVADADARIRKPGDLLAFEQYKAGDTLPAGEKVGDFKRIANGTQVKVDQVKVVPTGSSAAIVFAHALAKDGATELGWTSTRNFKGRFVNETLGATPPAAGANKFGPNAAWVAGSFKGQIALVEIISGGLAVRRVAIDTLEPYLDLVEAAAQDGVQVAINSGFRSYPEQKFLYEGYSKGLPGFNLAAKPGNSNHQNGIAFDIEVAGGSGNPVYDWLKKNAPRRGFVRTVNKEPWHWEYDKAKAAKAVAAHTFKTSNVVI